MVQQGREQLSSASVDIFEIDARGRAFWHAAIERLVATKARVQKLEVALSGKYVIFDFTAGQRSYHASSRLSTENREGAPF